MAGFPLSNELPLVICIKLPLKKHSENIEESSNFHSFAEKFSIDGAGGGF
jgi:hypothetical protein